MNDHFGRSVDYLRLSVTDRCNLRCRYCMPQGGTWLDARLLLTDAELVELCRQAAQLGIRRVKVTGGEPLLRTGCPELVGKLKALSGIEQVTLTTNGTLLAQYAEALRENGLDAVNVSLDTLNPERYARVTGGGALEPVLEGIAAAQRQQLPLKLNAVLQPDLGEPDWFALAELARSTPLDVRFIELMPIGAGKMLPSPPNSLLLARLRARYGTPIPDSSFHGNGPAVYYRFPGFTGSIGLISAVHGRFCAGCNRIRVTAAGDLKGCLCYPAQSSAREALRTGRPEDVRQLLRQTIAQKPEGHCFSRGGAVEKQEMSKIGG